MQAIRPGDILIVDGDTDYMAALKAILAGRGHTVTACPDMATARHQLEQSTFDVVLCGLRLPDGDGRQFCHEVKSAADSGPISVGLILDSVRDIEEVIYRPSGLRAVTGAELVAPDDFLTREAGIDEVHGRVQNLMRIGRYQEEINNSISTLMKVAEGVEEQDRRTGGHCRRLSIMSVELGATLGCDDYQLTALERAGYLHDIGKVSIPGALIDKTQRLSPREMEIIQTHCVLGERLCLGVAALKPVLPIIRHHHERADGTGYPDRLRGEEIPVLAQIFSIPDIYDSLRSWRPFRPAVSEAQAIDVLRQEVARGYWNRLIFDAFVAQVLPNLNERLDATHALWPE